MSQLATLPDMQPAMCQCARKPMSQLATLPDTQVSHVPEDR